jgi:hypothetical protein
MRRETAKINMSIGSSVVLRPEQDLQFINIVAANLKHKSTSKVNYLN